MQTVTVDDRQLAVEVRGQGPVLLLVHGFPLDHTMWSHQLDALGESWRLVAPDLPGFGRSPLPAALRPGDPLGMDALADTLAGLLDALAIDEPVTLCGLSMGGYVAWQFWRRHAERLARLVLCDTRAAADPPATARGRLAMAGRVVDEGSGPVAEGMLPKLFAAATRAEQPQLLEATRTVIETTSPASIAAAQRGMAARPDMTGLLGEIDVPALLVVGNEDVITPPDEMRQVAAAMPRATLEIIPNAGHMAPQEQPGPFHTALQKWLGRRMKDGG